MTLGDLQDEVSVELGLLETTVREAVALRRDVGERDGTMRERTAAAAYLAQFYGGIENILKRLCRFHAVALPSGETQHVELFRRFCDSTGHALPVLFDDDLSAVFSGQWKFRHVVHHGYGFQLDQVRIGGASVGWKGRSPVFRRRLESHLRSLEQGGAGAS